MTLWTVGSFVCQGVNRNYWSATSNSNNPATNAWNVNLSNGNTNNNNKTNTNNVRCVRALPPLALILF